jgi:hypothetical protein
MTGFNVEALKKAQKASYNGINTPTLAVVCDIKPIYAIIGTTMINERTMMITIFLLKSSW